MLSYNAQQCLILVEFRQQVAAQLVFRRQRVEFCHGGSRFRCPCVTAHQFQVGLIGVHVAQPVAVVRQGTCFVGQNVGEDVKGVALHDLLQGGHGSHLGRRVWAIRVGQILRAQVVVLCFGRTYCLFFRRQLLLRPTGRIVA